MDIREHLRSHHVRLDELFAALVAPGADAAVRSASYAEFESALIAHFEAEEAHLFPFLVEDFGDEIRALRVEHELLRREVSEIFGGLADGFDATRAADLGRRLSRHGQREDGMLYTLANDASGGERFERLVSYLEALYARMRDEGDEG